MKNISLKWTLSLVIAILLQVYVLNSISIDGIKPDFILILLVFYCLSYGQLNGIVVAFFAGLIFDFLSVGILGATSFSKVLAIFCCGYFYNENRAELILTNYNFIFIVLLISLIDSLVFSLLTIKADILTFSIFFFKFGIFPSIYTGILSALIYLKSPKKIFNYGR